LDEQPSLPTGLTLSVLFSGPDGTGLTTIRPERAHQLQFLNALDDRSVVLVGTAGNTRGFRSLNGLARLSVGPRVRVHPCDAPPTVLATLAAVMNAGQFAPGDTLEILRSLRAVTTTVAISNSVSRLVSPAPSVWQHLRGLLPRSTFVIDVPGRRVLAGAQVLKRLKRVHGGTLVLANAPDRQSLLWREELIALAPDAPRFVLDQVGAAAVPWRSHSWAEVTGLAVTVEAFASRLQMYLARQVCPSCLSSVSGTICPMCGVVSEPAGAQTAGRTGAVPLPPSVALGVPLGGQA
jgi:hypothetical protein